MRTMWMAVGFVGWLLGGLAYGADQTILGKQLQLKDPKSGVDATKRAFAAQGYEKGTSHTMAGDPTTNGASLTIFTRGASVTSQTFPLPAGGWSAKAGSLEYADSKLVAGPVKSVAVKVTKKAFQLKATVSGKNGGLILVPPNPGTGACVRLAIAGGDRYDVLFPAPPNATIEKNDAKTFQVKSVLAESSCDDLLVDPTGADHTYVVSAIDLPTNGSEAQALGLDLDGKPSDGVDNQLGAVLGSIGALAPTLNLQASIDAQVDQGTLVLLANVKTTSLTDAAGAGTWIYTGTTDMTPPACVDVNDTVCRQQFSGTGQFNVDLTAATDARLAGAITAGAFTGAAADTFPLKLGFGAVSMTLPLKLARAEIPGLTTNGWSAGKLGGAVAVTDIQSAVLPAIATLTRATFDETCEVGSTPPGCGCDAGSTGATLRNLFDKPPTQDCQISDLEVANVVNGFLTPDIDLDGDTTNDAVSMGVGLTAVPGTFTIP